jgi:tetratricopeptide (TPR) repeat protein
MTASFRSSLPPELQASLREAVTAFNAGRFESAARSCERVLARAPGNLRALGVYGAVLHAQERYTEAERVFGELVDADPNTAMHWMNLATARRGAGKFEDALRAYMRASELGCATADFYFNVGLTHLDRRDYESARAVLKKALELAPADALIRSEYVHACYETLQTDEALEALQGWTEFSGLTPEQLADVGQRMMNLGETERAEHVLSRLGSHELDARAMLTLAQIMERTNRLPEAQRLVEQLSSGARAASLGMDLLVTRAQLAQRAGDHERAREWFQEALSQVVHEHDRHFVLFPLAKSLDALKRYDEAFAAMAEAHTSQVAHLKLTAPMAVARGTPTWDITRWGCDPADIAQWDYGDVPALEESPVFVVAFPRSGTTLLEQTLDAHPQLKSMDEQPIVQAALDDVIAEGVHYPEEMGKLTAQQVAAIRARYFERAAAKVKRTPGQRIVDKNPLNMLRLPVIKRLFPNAPIILAVRHPCDVVLSCFMQHFRAPHFVMLCSDLQTLADGNRRSFDFWYEQSALLSPNVLEVRYESFVADFERGVREIADFLRLPWHDGMLAPAEHARAKGYISTPSYSQVVQPVNQKAVGRWRAYERHLAPIIPQLQTYLRRWDYSDR